MNRIRICVAGRRSQRLAIAFGLVLGTSTWGTWLLGTPGCFSPLKPACAFSCVEVPHTCPTDYTCGGDGFCHAPGMADVACESTPSDGADAGLTLDASDAAIDANNSGADSNPG